MNLRHICVSGKVLSLKLGKTKNEGQRSRDPRKKDARRK